MKLSKPHSEGISVLFIRPITSDDWSEYRKVRLSALKDAPDAFGSTWEQEAILPDEEWSARTIASASGQSGRGFFAVHGDEVCGLVWCLLSGVDPQIAHIYALWTAPIARGQGAGRALLEQCIAWARSRGAHTISLSVTEGESPAMQLYTSQGFYPVGETEFLRPGSDLKAQKMQLDLAVDS